LQNLVSCLAKIATPQFKDPLYLPYFYPYKKKKKKKKKEKEIAFEDLKTKISNRISGWKSKLPSQAG
jgi:hypothetical protein